MQSDKQFTVTDFTDQIISKSRGLWYQGMSIRDMCSCYVLLPEQSHLKHNNTKPLSKTYNYWIKRFVWKRNNKTF